MGDFECSDTKKGSYPGPINNFFLCKFKDYWHDPKENEFNTNFYLDKNIVESTHFSIVPRSIYLVFKITFGAINEIKRQAIKINEETLVEVHYKRVSLTLNLLLNSLK